MESTAISIIIPVLTALLGIAIGTAGATWSRMFKQVSAIEKEATKNGRDVKTLYRDTERLGGQYEGLMVLQGKTLDAMKELISQNNQLIQEIVAKK